MDAFDRDSPEGRRFLREARRQAGRECRRQELIAAARELIPDHGIAVPLRWLAVHAGVPVGAARGLYNASVDVALDLVRRAWGALIETTAPAPGTGPRDFVARVVTALRADPAAERIALAMGCGAAAWQRAAIAEAEAFLIHALGGGLGETMPALPPARVAAIGRPLLTLARLAASGPDAAVPAVEAAGGILAMLSPLLVVPADTADDTAAAAATRGDAPAPRPAADPIAGDPSFNGSMIDASASRGGIGPAPRRVDPGMPAPGAVRAHGPPARAA